MPRRKPTREESKLRTRRQLLRVASRLFLRDGFVATSLSAIAEEAGLTKGAVYSNFENKEGLFLASVQGDGPERGLDPAKERYYAPSDVAHARGEDAEERAVSFGHHAASLRPSTDEVALFLEMNAFALRNPRSRAWVKANSRGFFEALGKSLAERFGAADVDPKQLGLVAQSLYVGLMMHRAFDPEILPDEVFETTYALLVKLSSDSTRKPARRKRTREDA